MPDSSFDIVSEVDRQEVKNALQQVMKEVHTRFDFKGSAANVEETPEELVLTADDPGRLRALRQILEEKLARRGVPLKALSYDKEEEALGGRVRQRGKLQSGLTSEQTKDVVKRIKGSKAKVQASIQGDQVRVSGKKKDDLQVVITLLKEADLPFHWKATNYR